MSGDAPRPFGRYELLKRLGAGATGDVHLARVVDGESIGPVVVKRLHGELASDTRFVQRFRHEAEVAVRIDSRHVPRVLDAGRVGKTLYHASEYVAGVTFAQLINTLASRNQKISAGTVCELMVQGLNGLAALHSSELEFVHRDIAPKNIMLGDDGIVRIIDLGLGTSQIQDWRTRTDAVMGTPGYMAPEQALAQPTDRRTDLYAMGIVFWELLALSAYLPRDTIAEALQAAVAPNYRPPSRHRQDLTPAIDSIVKTALSTQIDKRYDSAAAFIGDLSRAMPGRGQKLETLASDLLGDEVRARSEELEALFGQPITHQPDAQRTVVFVRPQPAERAALPAQKSRPTTFVAGAGAVTLMAALFASVVWVHRQRTRPVGVVTTVPVPRATPKPLKAKAKAKADVKRKARSPVKPKPRTKPRSKAAAKPKVKDTGPEVPAAPQVDPIVERPADERLKYLVAALMRRAGRLEEQLPDGAKKSLVGRLRRRLVLEAGSSNPKTALERVRQIGNEISELEKP